MVPTAFPSGFNIAMAPVRASFTESVCITGVPFTMSEYTVLVFPVISLPFPVPIVLVVLGAPVTVGLVPIRGHGLAGTGEQD